MNFLAHIYLSGDDELVTIGNFMADGIKGKNYKKYPPKIQAGILLHREIDTFTDAHEIVKESTKKLHKRYRHYSGVIVDILYDHFLAKNWKKYSDTPLEEYVDSFYISLKDNLDLLPDRIKRLMPYMISDNWLYSYRKVSGIKKVLEGMNRRTSNRSKMNNAVDELEEHYEEFEDEFTRFFEELIEFSAEKRKELNKKYKLKS